MEILQQFEYFLEGTWSIYLSYYNISRLIILVKNEKLEVSKMNMFSMTFKIHLSLSYS